MPHAEAHQPVRREILQYSSRTRTPRPSPGPAAAALLPPCCRHAAALLLLPCWLLGRAPAPRPCRRPRRRRRRRRRPRPRHRPSLTRPAAEARRATPRRKSRDGRAGRLRPSEVSKRRRRTPRSTPAGRRCPVTGMTGHARPSPSTSARTQRLPEARPEASGRPPTACAAVLEGTAGGRVRRRASAFSQQHRSLSWRLGSGSGRGVERGGRVGEERGESREQRGESARGRSVNHARCGPRPGLRRPGRGVSGVCSADTAEMTSWARSALGA